LIRILFILHFLALMTGAATAWSQAPAESPYYARTNTFSIFSAYSGDSSHILLGDAENRMLLDFGVAYSRKLFLNRIVNWQYNGEILPVALESDPELQYVYYQTYPSTLTYDENLIQTSGHCVGGGNGTYTDSFFGVVTSSGTYTSSCTRRWTMGEGISPIGLQWNFLPRRKLQPFFIAHGGYMYSTQPIPVPEAGSFNFTFDVGAGFEIFRSKTRSIRAEYRYHHISNHDTASDNPGIDNGLFQLTYSFGK
jgi:opacity protein-like surface antigen